MTEKNSKLQAHIAAIKDKLSGLSETQLQETTPIVTDLSGPVTKTTSGDYLKYAGAVLVPLIIYAAIYLVKPPKNKDGTINKKKTFLITAVATAIIWMSLYFASMNGYL